MDDWQVYSIPTKIHKLLPERAYTTKQCATGTIYNVEAQTSFEYTTRQRKRFVKSPNLNVLPITYPISNNSNIVQFKLDPGQYDRILLIVCEVVLANTGASSSSVTPAPGYFLWTQIQIGINGSDSPWIFLNPREDYERLLYKSDETLRLLFANNSLNISSTDYKTGTAIAGGSSMFLSIPLLNPIWRRFNMDTLASPIYINFLLDANPVVANSSGTLQLQSFNLRIITEDNKATHKEMLSLFKTYPSFFPFVYSVQYLYNVSLTAGTPTDIQLSSCIGDVAMLVISVLNPGFSNANNGNITYISISGTDTTLTSGTLDLLNDNKNTLLGSGALTERYLRITNNLINGGNSLSLNQAILFLPFCRYPFADLDSGNINGYRKFTGTEFLRLTPGSTFTAGTYSVVVNTYYYKAFKQVDGIISMEY